MTARDSTEPHVRLDAEASPPDASHGELPTPILTSIDRAQATDDEIVALRAEVDDLTHRSERLRGRLLASEREAVLLSEHLTTKSALAGELRSEASVLRRDFEAGRLERASLGDQLASVRAQLDDRVRELDAARGQLAQAQADLSTTKVRVGLEQHLVGRLRDETGDLRTRLGVAEREHELVRDQLQAAQASVAVMTTELAASVANTESASADLDHARDETDLLRLELAASVASAKSASADLVHARDETDLLRLEMAAAATESASRERDRARIVELESGLSQAMTRAGTATSEAERSQGRFDQAQAEHLHTRELLASTEQTRDQYAHHLKATAPTTLGRVSYRWQRYGERHPRRVRAIRAPFEGFWKVLTLRWPSWLRQHPLFDKPYYQEANRDTSSGRLRPWWHYVRHGVAEGRSPNRYFDRVWYLRNYPDVEVAALDPLEHYYRRGCWEGRDPGPRFATDWYLANHPEVAAAGICPLLHFMQVGARAGYEPAPSNMVGRHPAHQPSRPAASAEVSPAADSRSTRPPSVAATSAPAPMAAVSPVRADVRGIRKLVADRLPEGARLGVISDGDDELLDLDRVAVTPVPRGTDGARAADVPRNDLSAIAHLESLRASHIDYLLAPDPSLWLTAVPGLAEYLDGRYARLSDQDAPAYLWDLGRPRLSRSRGAVTSPEAVLRGLRDRLGAEPSILDWGSGLDVQGIVPSATVFSPADVESGSLPYADASVDAVVFGAGPGRLDEARRMARALTIAVPEGRDDASIDWLDDDAAGTAASVSIIIPNYDDVAMVSACLRSLEETVPERIEAEFIIVDDGSPGAVVSGLETLVSEHLRARLVRNQANGGYIAAVTTGAASARHEILVFLNNDTVLLPGWLEPLLESLAERPQVGVVGGMLLYPDGRLQEAGCAIFRDGSATKIGYGDSDPSLPYYAHPRPVDYVSGALLATPRELFEELGGLDEAYGFGYYEDGDYCFKVRRAGREVLYQPASRVVHVEGGTAGMDLKQGPKQYQARNQALFIERWHDELERLPVRPEPLDLHASRDLVIRGSAPRASG